MSKSNIHVKRVVIHGAPASLLTEVFTLGLYSFCCQAPPRTIVEVWHDADVPLSVAGKKGTGIAASFKVAPGKTFKLEMEDKSVEQAQAIVQSWKFDFEDGRGYSLDKQAVHCKEGDAEAAAH